MLASSIPVSFIEAFGASAGASYIRAIPASSQISITPGAASLADGFPPLNFLPVASGGVPMSGKDLNGIMNEITAAIQWQQVSGLPIYNSTFSTAIGGYPAGAVLRATSTTGMWLSTADNNSTNPETGGSNWRLIGVSASQIQQGAFNTATDTGIVNASVLTLSPAPTLVQNMEIAFTPAYANTVTNPTITVNGTVLPLTGPAGAALTVGQVPAAPISVMYSTTGGAHLELQGIISRGVQKFTSNGSFTVPSSISTIYVSGCAGGGGGGNVPNTSASVASGGGGGGAGQAIIKTTYSVTPGQVITCTIGAGGTAGVSGGNTVIGSLVTLTGGSQGGTGGIFSGGAGGAGYPYGSDGSDAGGIAGTANSGPGSSCPFGGGGGRSRSSSITTGVAISGKPASGYGAGGGGAGGLSVTGTCTGANGGNGSPGIVIIEW